MLHYLQNPAVAIVWHWVQEEQCGFSLVVEQNILRGFVTQREIQLRAWSSTGGQCQM